jgi:hypothetical protein
VTYMTTTAWGLASGSVLSGFLSVSFRLTKWVAPLPCARPALAGTDVLGSSCCASSTCSPYWRGDVKVLSGALPNRSALTLERYMGVEVSSNSQQSRIGRLRAVGEQQSRAETRVGPV